MTKQMQLYRCTVCGNIVEVLHAGKGELTCCKEPMELLRANTTDASQEKHVPVIEKKDGMVTINVGGAPHPMEEKHFIEWVEAHTSTGRIFREFLKPGGSPAVTFADTGDDISATAYCNIHGLWANK